MKHKPVHITTSVGDLIAICSHYTEFVSVVHVEAVGDGHTQWSADGVLLVEDDYCVQCYERKDLALLAATDLE